MKGGLVMDEELHITLKDFRRALLRVKDSIIGESNVIEKVSLNGQELPVKDKGVDIVLPVATAEQAGTIKVGDGISVTEDGTASVDAKSVADAVHNNPEAMEALAGALLADDSNVDKIIEETFSVDRSQQS